MSKIKELVDSLERMGETLDKSAAETEAFCAEISYWLDQLSFSCYSHAQDLKKVAEMVSTLKNGAEVL
jgi:hypothetical protein